MVFFLTLVTPTFPFWAVFTINYLLIRGRGGLDPPFLAVFITDYWLSRGAGEGGPEPPVFGCFHHWLFDDKGGWEGGGLDPPFLADILCEQPLIVRQPLNCHLPGCHICKWQPDMPETWPSCEPLHQPPPLPNLPVPSSLTAQSSSRLCFAASPGCLPSSSSSWPSSPPPRAATSPTLGASAWGAAQPAAFPLV